ncbi:nuclear transport factor 2 family protein [Mesorhizobium sp. AR10]|nr:nuclear transport factor 2 family protein [Mesorhizobium sp. AR10]
MTVALAAPICAGAACAAQASDEVVAGLIKRAEEQAKLFNAGEMQRWYENVRLGENFTLMQPFGGPASHGFDASPERLAALAANFRNGDARLEVAATYASNDIVVLAYIERQHGEVHGLPNQDWSLRVTQVFMRDGQEWRLVHRHADPLVHQLSLDQTATLARGK